MEWKKEITPAPPPKKCWPHVHRYGKIDERGIQYCEICGRARCIKIECQHKWREKNKAEVYNAFNNRDGVFYILECEKCGEIVKRTLRL